MLSENTHRWLFVAADRVERRVGVDMRRNSDFFFSEPKSQQGAAAPAAHSLEAAARQVRRRRRGRRMRKRRSRMRIGSRRPPISVGFLQSNKGTHRAGTRQENRLLLRDVTRLRGQEVKSSLVAEDVSCRKKPMSCVVYGCSSRYKPREKMFFLVPKVVVVHEGEKCKKKKNSL